MTKKVQAVLMDYYDLDTARRVYGGKDGYPGPSAIRPLRRPDWVSGKERGGKAGLIPPSAILMRTRRRAPPVFYWKFTNNTQPNKTAYQMRL
jgi:hypothetical protein